MTFLTAKAEKKSVTFNGIQALRGFAACLVVLHHSTLFWARITHPALIGDPTGFWLNGNRGVDIFFVISGFVMTVSTTGKAAGWKAALTFLKRRFLRIFPMYWVVALIFVAVTLFLTSFPQWQTHGEHFPQITTRHVLQTLVLRPGSIVGVSWTLVYEIYFYLLFAIALAIRVAPVRLLTPLILALAFLGFYRPGFPGPRFALLTNELLLEFLAGVFIGMVALGHHRCKPVMAALMGVIGLVILMLHTDNLPSFTLRAHRSISYGVPAAMLVLSVVFLEEHIGKLWPRFALLIGDASYSLYLSHILCLYLTMGLFEASGFLKPGIVRRQDEWLAAAVSLIVCVAVAIPLYRMVEQPLQSFFLHRKRPKARIEIAVS